MKRQLWKAAGLTWAWVSAGVVRWDACPRPRSEHFQETSRLPDFSLHCLMASVAWLILPRPDSLLNAGPRGITLPCGYRARVVHTQGLSWGAVQFRVAGAGKGLH